MKAYAGSLVVTIIIVNLECCPLLLFVFVCAVYGGSVYVQYMVAVCMCSIW